MDNNQNPTPQIPKVAIIIATHNYAHFLKDAIDSAVNQDYPNKEIWIIDDASTDNTKEIMGQFPTLTGINSILLWERQEEIANIWRQNYNGVKIYYIILKKNGGPSRARNIGIVNAMRNGCHLFQILDADDGMRPNKITELIKPILLDPEKVCGSYADYTIWTLPQNTLHYESKEPYDIYKLYQNCIVHSGSLLSGPCLQKIAFTRQGRNYPEFYDEDLRVCEDYNLYLRLAKHFLFVHVPLDLTVVRNQPSNSSLTVDKNIWNQNYQMAKQRALQQ